MNELRLSRRDMALLMLAGGLGCVGDKARAAEKAASIRRLSWDELIPKDWDPQKFFRDKQVGAVREGDVGERALMREMRQIWDNAPTRLELNGLVVKLPGYVVPVEMLVGDIKEFLLVPYFGACVHTPPPPANQLVYVTLEAPKPLKTMDVVWVTGTMRTERNGSPFGNSGYRLEASAVEPYRAPAR
ncbi:DUF3299 domain-containing protein [Piscinibacter koreensis]|uniref:DUF3299 domain-containing protein n=1 Tax=Piscinibacter koreensis TaxID=2742824 RepID=A0A7Y6NNY5_9BURK|nr:DUF3299 domain-containing protein [Schlegelella koreensis]NUZ06683.1 DUF3299 domain-containing protein [Schlegelella koreensis]